MRKDIADLLDAPWLRKLKISPMPVETDLLDTTPDFRSRLKESLKSHGWQEDATMIIAASDDPRLDGACIQGRHRLLAIDSLIREGHKFNVGSILIRRVEVETADELRALRANFEASAALCKDPKLSKKWIFSNLKPLIEKRVSEGEQKILQSLRKAGFENDSIAKELIEDVLISLDRKEKNRARKKGRNIMTPQSISDPQAWGISQPSPTREDGTSYFRSVLHICPECRKESTVNLTVVCKGELVDVAAAPTPVQK